MNGKAFVSKANVAVFLDENLFFDGINKLNLNFFAKNVYKTNPGP